MEKEKMKAVLSAVGGWDADNKMTSNTKPEGGSLGGSWTGAFAATGKRRARQIRNFTLYPFCSEKNVRLKYFPRTVSVDKIYATTSFVPLVVHIKDEFQVQV
jgi:hypothetical protein